MNQTKNVRIDDSMTIAELKAAGYKLVAIKTDDPTDTTPQTTASRYAMRDMIAEIWAPSNWDKNWKWQSCHFGTSASDYEIVDGIAICNGTNMRIVALPAEMNKMVDGIENEIELGQFLSDYFNQEIEMVFCGYGRQNKGRAPIQRKIEIKMDEYHKNNTKIGA